MLRLLRPVTSGNVLIPIKTAFRTSDIANLKPVNFVFRFPAHKEHRVWRVFRVTLCLFTFILKKKTLRITQQCLHEGRYWKKTWDNYKNTFQFCSTPTHSTKAILMRPTSTTSVLGNLSYHVLDPLLYRIYLPSSSSDCQHRQVRFIDGWVNKWKSCTKI
jgi:hypothetical protein